MECGMSLMKFLLFGFNLLFALSGLIILITGAVIEAGYKEYAKFIPNEIFSAPDILIVVGIIIFVIAFFGCCGAMKENNCMLVTFAVLLMLVFVLEISAGIAAYVMRADLEKEITGKMEATMAEYNKTNPSIATQAWDTMQMELKCCGTHGYMDWDSHINATNGYPATCCGSLNQPMCDPKSPGFYTAGCMPKLLNNLNDNIGTVGGVGIGIAFIQLIGILFACRLSKSIRSGYETV